MKTLLTYLKTCLLNRENESMNMSMNHVHAEGIFSLVVAGDEFGKLTRIFVADKKLKPFKVQYHTHRYPITITVLKGNITHHTAVLCSDNSTGCVEVSQFNYKSFLNGGNGLTYDKKVRVSCQDYKLPIGSSIKLGVEDFHTMSCSKGSIWVVEEHGFKVEESKVLGVPFTVDCLYHKPAMFQINDKCQQVLKQVKRVLEAYSLVD